VARNADQYFHEGLRYQVPLRDQPVVLSYSATVDDLGRQYRLPRSALIDRNPSWPGPVRGGAQPVRAGRTVWLRQGASRIASGRSRAGLL